MLAIFLIFSVSAKNLRNEENYFKLIAPNAEILTSLVPLDYIQLLFMSFNEQLVNTLKLEFNKIDKKNTAYIKTINIVSQRLNLFLKEFVDSSNINNEILVKLSKIDIKLQKFIQQSFLQIVINIQKDLNYNITNVNKIKKNMI